MHRTVTDVQPTSQLEHNRAESRRDLYVALDHVFHRQSPSHPSARKCWGLQIIRDETRAAQIHWVRGRRDRYLPDVHSIQFILSGKGALIILVEEDVRLAVAVLYVQLQRNLGCERRVEHCEVERTIVSLNVCNEREW